jgi:hypothetical protein
VTVWTWQAPDGSVTDLSQWGAGSYVLAEGTSGQLAPEYEFTTDTFAGVDGEQLQDVHPQPAAPVLALEVIDPDLASLRARVRALAHVLRPRAGIGLLSATGDDGSVRNLPCYYRKGLEAGRYTASRFRAALTFWSPSPWWRGTPVAMAWGLAAPLAFFPFPPLVLSASTITGTVTVDLSDTDAPTFPTWTVTGPGSQLSLVNSYTARNPDGTSSTVTASLLLNTTIGDGQLVVVDTRQGRQAVNAATRNPDGTLTLGANLFSALGSDPALWPLVDGVNAVTAILAGAGPASRIELVADRLYSGAL